MNLSSMFPNPEWVICGMQMPKGVRIIASKALTRAEIEVQYQYQDIFDGPFSIARSLTDHDFTLTTHMRDCVIIDGPDYATVLQHLFEMWSPEPEKRKAIGPKDLGIEGSPTGRINHPDRPAIGY